MPDTEMISLPTSEFLSPEAQNASGLICVCRSEVNYSFDIINISKIVNGITLTDEKNYSGWIIMQYRGSSYLAFDLRNNAKNNKSPVTVVRANVLCNDSISSVVFIVEDETVFLTRLSKKPA